MITSGGTIDARYNNANLKDEEKKAILAQMVLLREFDLACERWWNSGEELVGEFHLSLGQEAFTIGTCAGIEAGDLICPSIRGMGVYLYRGVPMPKLIGSFLERQGSISEGRWAHWHSPWKDAGILPQTGMLGAGLVTAAGAALTQKLKRSGKIVVGMLGDGATNTGYFHEGVNFAAVQRLPMVIVIENNRIAVSTDIRDTALAEDLSDRAKGYGIPGATVDAADVLAVREAVVEAASRAREGGGPTLLELKAYRWGGQTLKDPNKERSEELKQSYREHCPIARLKGALSTLGILSEGEFEAIVADSRGKIAEAEAEGRALPKLNPSDFADILGSMPVGPASGTKELRNGL